ncbi:hypothetical protein SK128_017217, partial [Halocaridina rubra]
MFILFAFQIRIEKVSFGYCGSLGIGLTSLPIGNSYPSVTIPASLSGIESADTWWVSGSDVRRNGSSILRLNYCPNLGRLLNGDLVGIKRTTDGAMRVYINGEDFGVAATNVTKRVFGVVDLFGYIASVCTTSVSRQATSPVMDSTIVATTATNNNNAVSQDSLELSQQDSRHPPTTHGALTAGFHPATSAHIPHLELRPLTDSKASSVIDYNRQENGQNSRHALNAEMRLNGTSQGTLDTSTESRNQSLLSSCPKEIPVMQFHEKTGKNVQLSTDKLSAKRSESYNQGIVMSAKHLPRNVVFQVRLGTLNSRWSSSLMVGVTAQSPEKLHLPNTAFALKRNTWVVCGDSVFYNGVKIKGRYGPDLDSLAGGTGGHLVGVMVDNESRLHLLVNGVDQGVAAKEIPPNPYVVLDLYGQCQEVVITNTLANVEAPTSTAVSSSAAINPCSQTVTSNTVTNTAAITTIPVSNTNTVTTMVNTVPTTNAVVVTSATQIGNEQNKKNLLKTHHHHHHHHHNHHHTHNIQQQQQQQQQPLLQQQPLQQQPSGVITAHNLDNTGSNITNNNDAIRQPTSNNSTEHITQPHPPKDKEKGISRSLPDSSIVKNCEYQNMCQRFKASLALPEGYFNPEGNLCFCETCHKIRGDEPFYSKGNPPKHYAQPFGWCRFGLVSGVGDNNDSWHMAYHGTRPGAIRRMLDKGELLFS